MSSMDHNRSDSGMLALSIICSSCSSTGASFSVSGMADLLVGPVQGSLGALLVINRVILGNVFVVGEEKHAVGMSLVVPARPAVAGSLAHADKRPGLLKAGCL